MRFSINNGTFISTLKSIFQDQSVRLRTHYTEGQTTELKEYSWSVMDTSAIAVIWQQFWSMLTWLHYVIIADVLGAFSCCESPILPNPKGAPLDLDPVYKMHGVQNVWVNVC